MNFVVSVIKSIKRIRKKEGRKRRTKVELPKEDKELNKFIKNFKIGENKKMNIIKSLCRALHLSFDDKPKKKETKVELSKKSERTY